MNPIELARRIARHALPEQMFRFASRSADEWAARRALPAPEARELLEVLHGDAGDVPEGTLTLHPSMLREAFTIRRRRADARSLLGTCLRSEYAPFLPSRAPGWVVDAGAYTGDFAALAATRFPSATVVAIEPQPDAAALARRNLAPYGERVVVVEGALWATDAIVRFEGQGVAGRVVERGGQYSTQGVSMCTLLKRVGVPRAEMFKCDIEGAERVVFASDYEAWLPHTDELLIELHGADSEAEVRAACSNAGLRYVGRHRNTHCFRRGR